MKRYLLRGGQEIELHSWFPLAMAIPGWISFCVLQWIGLRIRHHVDDGGIVRWDGVRFAWPLTGWFWSWRKEIIVPVLMSLPTLVTIGAVAWWLL